MWKGTWEAGTRLHLGLTLPLSHTHCRQAQQPWDPRMPLIGKAGKQPKTGKRRGGRAKGEAGTQDHSLTHESALSIQSQNPCLLLKQDHWSLKKLGINKEH